MSFTTSAELNNAKQIRQAYDDGVRAGRTQAVAEIEKWIGDHGPGVHPLVHSTVHAIRALLRGQQ